MELRLCKTVELFCSSVRNIAPHISLHDLPHHRTMKKCLRQVSLSRVVFLLLPRRFWIQTYFPNYPQYLCFFDKLVDCNRKKRGQGTMWVEQIDFIHEYLPHWVNVLFLSSQFCTVHKHRQAKSFCPNHFVNFLELSFL